MNGIGIGELLREWSFKGREGGDKKMADKSY
jgi:hypothetical protein